MSERRRLIITLFSKLFPDQVREERRSAPTCRVGWRRALNEVSMSRARSYDVRADLVVSRRDTTHCGPLCILRQHGCRCRETNRGSYHQTMPH